MKLNTFKNYRICNTCNIEKPLNRKFFARYGDVGFHETCRYCEEKIHIDNNTKGNLYICNNCKQYKPKEDFPKNARNGYRGFTDRRCTKCKSKNSFEARCSKTGDELVARVITERFLAAKLRATKSDLKFNITKEYIDRLLKEQNGLCAVSNIKMTFDLGKGRTFTNMSIDKIDCSNGYTIGNIQLVCMAINQMKSDMSMEELYIFSKHIVDTYENKNNQNSR